MNRKGFNEGPSHDPENAELQSFAGELVDDKTNPIRDRLLKDLGRVIKVGDVFVNKEGEAVIVTEIRFRSPKNPSKSFLDVYLKYKDNSKQPFYLTSTAVADALKTNSIQLLAK